MRYSTKRNAFSAERRCPAGEWRLMAGEWLLRAQRAEEKDSSRGDAKGAERSSRRDHLARHATTELPRSAAPRLRVKLRRGR